MNLLTLLQALEHSEFSLGMRESQYWFPALNLCHMLGLLVAAGTVVFWDLRLLGVGLRTTPVSQVGKSLLPWTWAGFVVMFLSGSLLVVMEAGRLYDNIFFRDHCKELLKVPMLMVREFIKNNYRLTCFVGLENSPTCGIHWGKHKVNRYQTESPNVVDKPDPNDPPLTGIMPEILSEELATDALKVPFLEFPALSPAGSPQRKKFWEDLQKAVEPLLGAGGGNDTE